MTEPVAYRVDGTIYNNIDEAKFAVREIKHLRNELEINNGLIRKLVYIEPLYKKEQLHPRVKMTKKQYDRLMFDKENTDLSTCLGYFLEHDGVNNFGLPSENLMGLLKQEDIARAWLNPEETIEIVPTMKWFVRSKETDDFCQYGWLSIITKFQTPIYQYSEDQDNSFVKFDTKEEAEKWTNPLTEAVQLPVEEK